MFLSIDIRSRPIAGRSLARRSVTPVLNASLSRALPPETSSWWSLSLVRAYFFYQIFLILVSLIAVLSVELENSPVTLGRNFLARE